MNSTALRIGPAGAGLLLTFLTPLAAPPVAAQVMMTDVSVAAGLDGVTYGSSTDHSLGMCWIDYDDDGWDDLFAVGGNPQRTPRLYRNRGDGTFEDTSDLLPELPLYETSGAVYADYDKDGDLDLYVYTDHTVWEPADPMANPDDGPPNYLLRNLWVENGGGVVPGEPLFAEVAAAAGVDDLAETPLGVDYPGHRAKTAGFVDFDRDGCIDLFVGHWVMNEADNPANGDRLYRNLCDGTFEDVTATSGIDPGGEPTRMRAALAFIGSHLDGDLWPDLYVVNAGGGSGHGQPYINDFFYRNNAGAGGTLFTEASGEQPGICDDAQAGMGIDVADVDRDGDWDFYISDLRFTTQDELPKGNVLYLGNGDGTFADNSAVAAGVEGHNSWGVNFFDVDHDGWEDLYVSTMAGADGDEAELLFINDGPGAGGMVTFTNVGVAIGMSTGNARGSAVADYDRDGDLDLAVVSQGGPLQLFRNDTVGTGHWLQIVLRGSESSREGIGAVVEATVGGAVLRRQLEGGSSAHSQDSRVVHLGLGDAATVDLLRVLWPSGRVDELTGVAADRRITVREGQLFADGFESGDFSGWGLVIPRGGADDL